MPTPAPARTAHEATDLGLAHPHGPGAPGAPTPATTPSWRARHLATPPTPWMMLRCGRAAPPPASRAVCATQSTALPGAASLCPVPLHGLRPLATSFGHLLPACGGVVLVATTTSALARGPLVKCAGAERPPACDSCLARVALADAALPSFVSLAALEVDGGRYRPTPTLGALACWSKPYARALRSGPQQRVTLGALAQRARVPLFGLARDRSGRPPIRSNSQRGEIRATPPPANGVPHRGPSADADTGTGVLTVDVEDGHISTPA